jgi:hypothetical protein
MSSFTERAASTSRTTCARIPEPYVPRHLTFEIDERILSDETILEPLDEEQVRRQIRRLVELEVAAVGVCLLWSPVNPRHEQRVGELLRELVPSLEFTLSHRLNPHPRGDVRETSLHSRFRTCARACRGLAYGAAEREGRARDYWSILGAGRHY